MNGERELPVSQDIAWQALNDLSLLQSCIPGCESIETRPDGSFDVRMTATVGPVKARFKGDMSMKDVTAPDSYTLVFSGQGGAVGYGRGEARVALSPGQAGTTVLRYEASATVGGKLAQVGSRLIDIAAQKMAADFFDAFLAELNKRHAPARVEPVVDTPSHKHGIWAAFAAWLRNLLGGRKTTARTE